MMHIVMFSINPLFPDRVMGGAPKHLQNIATHMGELGHEVTVLCSRVTGSTESFQWGDTVTVQPVLPFKQPFPQPYAITAHDMALVLQEVGDYLATADRFYMHDGEMLFPYAYQHIPTVISLRDNVYPETLLGGYLFQGDKLIVISEYSRRLVDATVGRFFPDLGNRTQVIHNGIDWDVFKPTAPDDILSYLPIDPNEHTVILHPHRPEESKGIRQTIAVIDLLVNQYGLTDIKTLIPKWLNVQSTSELRDFYTAVEREITGRSLQDHITFHEWIPQALMPQYYSLGAVTLSLGHFPESFGNAVYESLGCGTLSIAARISTHRELLPEGMLDKVNFNDAEAAAEKAAAIIREHRTPSQATLDYLRDNYSIDQQLSAYAEAILNAEVAEPLLYRHKPIDDSTRFSLAPWCFITDSGRVYHDFRADYTVLGALRPLIDANPVGFTFIQAEAEAVSRNEIIRWYRQGYLVPR